MPETESRRLALYNGLRELKAELKTDISRLSGRIDKISERMDKMQHTMGAGFVAMVAAVLGSGLLG